MTEIKPAKTAVLRVGKIRYTNSLPFYYRLTEDSAESYRLSFLEGAPAEINLAMQQSKIDIGPVSSLEYLNHQKDYLLLPGLAIGSRDFSGSVLLFSREKIEGLDKKEIALSRESLSSAALLRILLKSKYKFENSFTTVDSNPRQMLAQYPAALVIGNDALFHQSDEFVYKYDLSELWWNWTEKPFCFALWAVRRDFASRHPKEVASFIRLLKTNLLRNLEDIEKLLKEALKISFTDKDFSKIFGYLFNLSYGLDPSMHEGLELFYRMAHRLGISPKPEKLEFFEGD